VICIVCLSGTWWNSEKSPGSIKYTKVSTCLNKFLKVLLLFVLALFIIAVINLSLLLHVSFQILLLIFNVLVHGATGHKPTAHQPTFRQLLQEFIQVNMIYKAIPVIVCDKLIIMMMILILVSSVK
jgi:hypothetical protein